MIQYVTARYCQDPPLPKIGETQPLCLPSTRHLIQEVYPTVSDLLKNLAFLCRKYNCNHFKIYLMSASSLIDDGYMQEFFIMNVIVNDSYFSLADDPFFQAVTK